MNSAADEEDEQADYEDSSMSLSGQARSIT
jgi:hypothetical protein